jgi:hypothetical protein
MHHNDDSTMYAAYHKARCKYDSAVYIIPVYLPRKAVSHAKQHKRVMKMGLNGLESGA